MTAKKEEKKIERKSLPLLLMMLLLMTAVMITRFSYAANCSKSSDCPVPDCSGSVAVCSDNACKYSGCILETGAIQKTSNTDNNYPDYSNDIVDSINVSKLNIRSQQGFYESVLEWASFNKMVLFSAGILAIIFIVIMLVILWQMIKTSPIILVIIVVLLVLITAAVVLFVISNPGAIERMMKGDFSFLSEKNVDELAKYEKSRQDSIVSQKSFSNEFDKAIDPNVNYAKEIKINSGNSTTSVIMLEFNSENSALSYIDNKIKATDKTKNILGKIAYIYDVRGSSSIKTYRVLSDNRIFLFTGDEQNIESTIDNIFSGQNQGNIEDAFEIETDDVSCLTNNTINFKILDMTEKIASNNYSVVVEGTSGFDFNENSCAHLSYGYDCSFAASLDIGKNDITINVVQTDYSGGQKKVSIIQKKEFTLNYDPIAPQSRIDFSNRYHNIRFSLSDTGTGIDTESMDFTVNNKSLDRKNCVLDGLRYTCDYEINPVEGNNIITESFRDRCGNEASDEKSFVYDTTPPVITIDSKRPKIIEIYDSSGVKSITIDGKYFDPNSCMIQNDTYTCTIPQEKYGNLTVNVVVEDIFSNKVTKYV